MDFEIKLPAHWAFSFLKKNLERAADPKAYGFAPHSPPQPLWVAELAHPGTGNAVQAGGDTAEEALGRAIAEVQRREGPGLPSGHPDTMRFRDLVEGPVVDRRIVDGVVHIHDGGGQDFGGEYDNAN